MLSWMWYFLIPFPAPLCLDFSFFFFFCALSDWSAVVISASSWQSPTCAYAVVWCNPTFHITLTCMCYTHSWMVLWASLKYLFRNLHSHICSAGILSIMQTCSKVMHKCVPSQECPQQTPMLCPQILDEIHFCIVKFFFLSTPLVGWFLSYPQIHLRNMDF